jgi:hypothetical protein
VFWATLTLEVPALVRLKVTPWIAAEMLFDALVRLMPLTARVAFCATTAWVSEPTFA